MVWYEKRRDVLQETYKTTDAHIWFEFYPNKHIAHFLPQQTKQSITEVITFDDNINTKYNFLWFNKNCIIVIWDDILYR